MAQLPIVCLSATSTSFFLCSFFFLLHASPIHRNETISFACTAYKVNPSYRCSHLFIRMHGSHPSHLDTCMQPYIHRGEPYTTPLPHHLLLAFFFSFFFIICVSNTNKEGKKKKEKKKRGPPLREEEKWEGSVLL